MGFLVEILFNKLSSVNSLDTFQRKAEPLSAGRLSDPLTPLLMKLYLIVQTSHKALSAGRLSDSTIGIARPNKHKIAISTKLNFLPKKYSRKVTKIILNPRRFVLLAICLFQMYLIPDCYRTSNDFQMFSNNFFWTSIRFSFSNDADYI